MGISMSDIGAIASQNILTREYIASEICNPATSEFFNLGFEEDGFQDASIALHSGRSAESTVDHRWISDETVPAQNTVQGTEHYATDQDGTGWQLLCSQLLSANEQAVPDEDLLALLLSYLKSGVNSRTLATQLITRFETFGNVVSARSAQITGAAQIGPEVIEFFKVVRAAGTRLAREEIGKRPVLDAWEKLVNYLRSAMAHQPVEQFRVLFPQCADCRRSAASRNDRSHASISARGCQARPGARRLGRHHGAQPSQQSSGSVQS
jgi:hypothetical protein